MHYHAPHPAQHYEDGVTFHCVGKLDCEVNQLAGVNPRRSHVRTHNRPGWFRDEALNQFEVVAGNRHGRAM